MPRMHESVAAVAHELRLPLSHIKGFVSTLRRTDLEWDEQTRRDFLAEIDLEADRLAAVVDSLLDPARPEHGRARPSHLELTHPMAVVEGAAHRVRGLLAHRELRRSVPQDLKPLRMHANQMERVLANLMQNAIRYSPAGTPIHVFARVTSTNELVFVVQDQGPGIPDEQREQIFEPFFRGNSAEASVVHGNGLGLAICLSIVQEHRGRLEVGRAPSGGAAFSVFLPYPVPANKIHDGTEEHGRARLRRLAA